MNVSEMRPPPRGFEDRLEADLVKVVTARAALPQRPRQRAAAAMRRPAVRAGVLAVGTAVAAAAGFAFGGPSLSHRQAAPPRQDRTRGGPVHIRTAAFSVDSYTDGTVHVTWDKSQYIRSSQDIAGLQQALREAGFPVLIKEGVFCKGPHDNGYLGRGGVGPGVGQVMKGENGARRHRRLHFHALGDACRGRTVHRLPVPVPARHHARAARICRTPGAHGGAPDMYHSGASPALQAVSSPADRTLRFLLSVRAGQTQTRGEGSSGL